MEETHPPDNLWACYFGHYAQPLLQNLLIAHAGSPLEGLLEAVAGEMKRLQAVAVFPLISHGELLGYLLLGERKSEEPYTSDDLLLLRNAVNQTALAYERYLLDQGLSRSPKTGPAHKVVV